MLHGSTLVIVFFSSIALRLEGCVVSCLIKVLNSGQFKKRVMADELSINKIVIRRSNVIFMYNKILIDRKVCFGRSKGQLFTDSLTMEILHHQYILWRDTYIYINVTYDAETLARDEALS